MVVVPDHAATIRLRHAEAALLRVFQAEKRRQERVPHAVFIHKTVTRQIAGHHHLRRLLFGYVEERQNVIQGGFESETQ
jgi:hypothetical protein